MTLDEFMAQGTHRGRNIRREGFLFLFLRLREGPVLEIAVVTVQRDERGRGLFTKTLRHIKYKYPDVSIRVEGVKEPRFQQHLLKLGFEQSTSFDFFLAAQKDLTPSR
jgi:hypothetical protein